MPAKVLDRDDKAVTSILLKRLQDEGIEFILNGRTSKFVSANDAMVKLDSFLKEAGYRSGKGPKI